MTDQKKETKTRLEEEFAALSLEEKIASLMRMEVATLGETLTYIANSSSKAVEKAGEFITEVSSKIEFEVNRGVKSAKTKANGDATKASEPEPKARSAKRPPKPKASKP